MQVYMLYSIEDSPLDVLLFQTLEACDRFFEEEYEIGDQEYQGLRMIEPNHWQCIADGEIDEFYHVEKMIVMS